MNKDQTKIGFVLKQITTEQFATIPQIHNEGKESFLNVRFNFAINTELHLLGVLAQVNFSHNKNPFLIIEVACHFEVAPETWIDFTADSEPKFIVPVGFMRHLAMLTIGTARGVLHAKTENTVFNKYLIPTINVVELIHEDIVFEIAEN
jgi:hypothetical protein